MSRIAQETVEAIKDATDIVDYVSEYVELKRRGNRFWACCPFHLEKTPSFTVREEEQDFKCFGCGEYGDVITFCMKMENLTYPEALRFLADRSGIEIVEEKEDERFVNKKKLYLEICDWAMSYFYRNLLLNRAPQNYLVKRNLDSSVINTFMLGFALDDWHDLIDKMKDKGYREEDLEDLGLTAKSEKTGNYYDKFRNRLIFPIFDDRNHCIGFGGRAIGEDKPKYLNSSESLIFKKRNNLYSYNNVRKSKSDSLILVEGYMDVIGLYHKGIDYALASLGTALTVQQVKMIKKLNKKVYICYDGDSAGISAAKKAIELFDQEGVETRIVSLPDGQDPDEYIIEYGREAFEKILENSDPSKKYLIKREKIGLDLSKGEDRIDFINRIVPILSKIELDSVREEYISWIALDMGLDKNSLNRDVNRAMDNLNILPGSRQAMDEGKKKNSFSIDYNIWANLLSYAMKSNEHAAILSVFYDMIPDPYRGVFKRIQEGNIEKIEEEAGDNRLDIDWHDILDRSEKLPDDIEDDMFIEFIKRTTIILNRQKLQDLKEEAEELVKKSQKDQADEKRYMEVLEEIEELNSLLQQSSLNL